MIKMFFDYVDYNLWNYVLEFPVIPTPFVDYKVMDKSINIWTAKEKRKIPQVFQARYLMVSALSTRE